MPILIGSITLIIIGCVVALILYFIFKPKTVKGQISRYQSKLARLEAIALKFPNFYNVVSTIKADAKIAYDEAMQVADEKERIQALERSIKILNPKFSQSLASLEFPKTKLDELYEECSKLNKEANGLTSMMSLYDDMIATSNRDFFDSLGSANPKTEMEATNLVNNSFTILDPVAEKLEASIDELREKIAMNKQEVTEKLDSD